MLLAFRRECSIDFADLPFHERIIGVTVCMVPSQHSSSFFLLAFAHEVSRRFGPRYADGQDKDGPDDLENAWESPSPLSRDLQTDDWVCEHLSLGKQATNCTSPPR